MRTSLPSNRTHAPRAYLIHGANICPDCGSRHWHVGRFSAQCALCDAPLPFTASGPRVRTGGLA